MDVKTIYNVVEFFWTRGNKGKERSYYNSKEREWEDIVEIDGTIARFLHLRFEIAEFDGRYLSMHPLWESLAIFRRLSLITRVGERYGYRIPLKPVLSNRRIYWVTNYGTFVPKYPLIIDVVSGRIMSDVNVTRNI